MEIKIDTTKAEATLKRLGADGREGINIGIGNFAAEVEKGAKLEEQKHAKTSNLFNSISNFIAPNGKGWILRMSAKNKSGHNYASDVYYGTKAHVIGPKDKKALFWPGAKYPVKKVNHPGFRGRPSFELVAGRINAQAAFDSGVNNFLTKRGW